MFVFLVFCGIFINQKFFYFAGLLDTFKSKISRGQQLPSINIAVRLTYTLRMLSPWESLSSLASSTDIASSVLNVPFGTGADPIR